MLLDGSDDGNGDGLVLVAVDMLVGEEGPVGCNFVNKHKDWEYGNRNFIRSG